MSRAAQASFYVDMPTRYEPVELPNDMIDLVMEYADLGHGPVLEQVDDRMVFPARRLEDRTSQERARTDDSTSVTRAFAYNVVGMQVAAMTTQLTNQEYQGVVELTWRYYPWQIESPFVIHFSGQRRMMLPADQALQVVREFGPSRYSRLLESPGAFQSAIQTVYCTGSDYATWLRTLPGWQDLALDQMLPHQTFQRLLPALSAPFPLSVAHERTLRSRELVPTSPSVHLLRITDSLQPWTMGAPAEVLLRTFSTRTGVDRWRVLLSKYMVAREDHRLLTGTVIEPVPPQPRAKERFMELVDMGAFGVL